MGTTIDTPPSTSVGGRASIVDYIILARPKQWAKGAFVFIGPIYGLAIHDTSSALAVVGAFLAFGFASSACYVHNDVRDRELDRAHPRKCKRPIASGRIGIGAAYAFFVMLLVLACGMLLLVPNGAANHWQRELLVHRPRQQRP